MYESITSIWDVLGPIITSFGADYPIVATIVFFMATFRIFMKPIMTAITKYIERTPTKSDNKKLAKIKKNVIYKIVIYILDWSLSIKLPK